MKSIMCPAARFVDSRIIRVSGRMNWENSSISGRKTIRATGDPVGTRWAIKALMSE